MCLTFRSVVEDYIVIVNIMGDNTVIGYSTNDFFYESLKKDNNGGVLVPSDDECKIFLSHNWEDVSCNTYFSDNSINCIKYSLCKNKENANQIKLLENEDKFHNEQNSNTNDNLKNTLLNTMNLSIGILFIFFVIYKLQSMQKKRI